jgi:hypothetical protein
MDLPNDPATPAPGTYTEETKSVRLRGIRIPLFIAAPFTIIKENKQSECPPTDEGIKKHGPFTQMNSMHP